MSRLFGIIFFLLSPLQVLGQTCLDSSVFPVNDQRQIFGPNLRSFITVNGAPTSVGIFSYNWASAELVAAVFKVLNREIIGYNTDVVNTTGTTMAALFGLGGCTEPNSFASGYTGAGCGAEINQWHFTFEAWGGGNIPKMAVMEKELKQLSPENLGSLGYTGTESLYVVKQNYKAAWEQAGLALEFYRSYDAAWFDPAQFFNPLSAIPGAHLKNCHEHVLTVHNDPEMRNFLKYTNDTDGVEIVNGKMQAICPDNGPWWYSPACRNDTSKCVPIITAGNGYGVGGFMQAAAGWNFPVAIATAASWGAWGQIPRLIGSMFYWWTPDTTFVDLEPVECLLPPHDALAYAAGDKRSGPTRVDLSSWANNRMRNIAPEAVDLAQRMKWNIDGESGINKALVYKVATVNATWDTTACWWVRNFRDVWKNWIRDPTECSPGQGIVDAGAGYLLSKNVSHPGGGIAVACEFCKQGTESKEIKDTDGGYIFVCSPCEQGYFQEGAGATECLHCPLGSFTGEEESTACVRCDKGDYSDMLGSSVCTDCISPYTTLGSGSVSATDCVCPEEMYLNLQSVCVECPPGMVCEEGSAESNIPAPGAGLERLLGAAGPYPMAAKNFMTQEDDPLNAYACTIAFVCPGGAPGQCSEGRTGLACAACLDENKPDGETGRCGACTGSAELAVVLFWVMLTIVTVVIFFATNGATPMPPTPRLCLTSCTSLGLQAVQMLGVVSLLSVNYPDSIKEAFQTVQWSMLDLDKTLWVLWCTYNHSPHFKFFSTCMVFPYICMCLAVFALLGKMMPGKVPFTPTKAANSAGAFLLGAFISMTSVAMTPMVCYEHPNGTRSVVAYSQVLCWQGEHWSLFIVGLILLMSAMFIVAGIFYIVIQAPGLQSKQGGAQFFETFRFLFNLFRTDKWWWSLVLIPRGLMLSLIRVMAPDSPNVQVLVMVILLSVYAALVGTSKPWKVPLMNLLDSAVAALIVVCLCSASAFMPEPTNPEGIYSLMIAVVVIILLLTGAAWATAVCFVVLELRNLGQKPPVGQETSVGVCKYFLMKTHDYKKLSVAVQAAFAGASQIKAQNLEEMLQRWQIYDATLLADMLQVFNSYNLVEHPSLAGLKQERLKAIPQGEPIKAVDPAESNNANVTTEEL